MHRLGLTRSVRRQDHAVFTADSFVRAALPGMKKAVAIIHAAPAIGAGFTRYTAELESGGCLGDLPRHVSDSFTSSRARSRRTSQKNGTLLRRTITLTFPSNFV